MFEIRLGIFPQSCVVMMMMVVSRLRTLVDVCFVTDLRLSKRNCNRIKFKEN